MSTSNRSLASAASTMRSAGMTNIFEGMHPALRHVPPNTARSTIATFQSSNSGVSTELPEPVPMMTRSKSDMAAQ